jgi:putative membrane protein
MMDGWYFGGWMMAAWALVFIIFWAAVITLIIWAIRKFSNRDSGMTSSVRQTPLEIARERYAKGEITKEQFEQLKRDLGG